MSKVKVLVARAPGQGKPVTGPETLSGANIARYYTDTGENAGLRAASDKRAAGN